MFLSLAEALAAAGGAQAPWWYTMGPILIMVLIFYFILIRPQVKQQKEHQSLINNIKKGDKVVTNGGIWGEVDTVDNQTVRLKVAEKTKLMVTRSAITGFQPKPGEKTEQK